jgi:hypothetical protein
MPNQIFMMNDQRSRDGNGNTMAPGCGVSDAAAAGWQEFRIRRLRLETWTESAASATNPPASL